MSLTVADVSSHCIRAFASSSSSVAETIVHVVRRLVSRPLVPSSRSASFGTRGRLVYAADASPPRRLRPAHLRQRPLAVPPAALPPVAEEIIRVGGGVGGRAPPPPRTRASRRPTRVDLRRAPPRSPPTGSSRHRRRGRRRLRRSRREDRGSLGEGDSKVPGANVRIVAPANCAHLRRSRRSSRAVAPGMDRPHILRRNGGDARRRASLDFDFSPGAGTTTGTASSRHSRPSSSSIDDTPASSSSSTDASSRSSEASTFGSRFRSRPHGRGGAARNAVTRSVSSTGRALRESDERRWTSRLVREGRTGRRRRRRCSIAAGWRSGGTRATGDRRRERPSPPRGLGRSFPSPTRRKKGEDGEEGEAVERAVGVAAREASRASPAPRPRRRRDRPPSPPSTAGAASSSLRRARRAPRRTRRGGAAAGRRARGRARAGGRARAPRLDRPRAGRRGKEGGGAAKEIGTRRGTRRSRARPAGRLASPGSPTRPGATPANRRGCSLAGSSTLARTQPPL